jgi:hypothetical protein
MQIYWLNSIGPTEIGGRPLVLRTELTAFHKRGDKCTEFSGSPRILELYVEASATG